MQTFLPFADFSKSAQVLDPKRRWKQCVEARQILNTLDKMSSLFPGGKKVPWSSHPAILMWVGHETMLKRYFNSMLVAVIRSKSHVVKAYGCFDLNDELRFAKDPGWLGNEKFHAAHRSNLMRKDSLFYGQYGWSEPADLPYLWPTKDEL